MDVRVGGTRVSGESVHQHRCCLVRPTRRQTTAAVEQARAFFTQIDDRDHASGTRRATWWAGAEIWWRSICGRMHLRPLTDNGDGTYTMPTVVTLNFTPTVVITLNGAPISGSPFHP